MVVRGDAAAQHCVDVPTCVPIFFMDEETRRRYNNNNDNDDDDEATNY